MNTLFTALIATADGVSLCKSYDSHRVVLANTAMDKIKVAIQKQICWLLDQHDLTWPL